MKVLIKNYNFDPIAKTIVFADYASIILENVLLVTNVTDNQIIYNFADSTSGGTVTQNVLNLSYDTTSMSSTDSLQIFYDDGLAAVSEDLAQALYDVAQSLQVISAARGNLADLRVQLTAAPITLQGVSTVLQLSSKGSKGLDISTEPKDLSNLLAMSNINNIQ